MEINTVSFTPSGSPVTLLPEFTAAGTFLMPSVDANNLDLLVTNQGATLAYLAFAAGAPAGAGVVGNLVVSAGATVLCTANAATLAAAAANPSVVSPQAGSWQTATSVSVAVNQKGTAVTLQRGTALARPVF